MRGTARQVDKDERLLRFANSLRRLRTQQFWKAQASETESADTQKRTSRKAIAVAVGGLFGERVSMGSKRRQG